MRVALVSPYSYTYPGGVGRHVEALASELSAQGHEVRLLAPHDPDDRLARVLHRGAAPERRPVPDYMIPLGRTVGLPANGAVSNLSVFPESVATLGKELRNGGYDIVHVHEPNAPFVSWFAAEARAAADRGHVPHLLHQLAGRHHRRQRGGSAAPLLQAERAHRGVGGRRVDRAPVLRRPVQHRAQRRGPERGPAGSRKAARAAPHPVRRPRRESQGPARAAARLRGAARSPAWTPPDRGRARPARRWRRSCSIPRASRSPAA